MAIPCTRVCCVALACCLFDLASFFLPSHLSLKHVHVAVVIIMMMHSSTINMSWQFLSVAISVWVSCELLCWDSVLPAEREEGRYG